MYKKKVPHTDQAQKPLCVDDDESSKNTVKDMKIDATYATSSQFVTSAYHFEKSPIAHIVII